MATNANAVAKQHMSFSPLLIYKVVVDKKEINMVEDPTFFAHYENKVFLSGIEFFVTTITIRMVCMAIVCIKQNQRAKG